jgi:hypothetical protein
MARERRSRRLALLNQRHETARAVASELLPAEQEVDSAIVRNAKLTIAVVEGRRRCKLPLSAGQEGLSYIADATARLVDARALLAKAHTALRATQDEIGLQAFSYGDATECPPSTGERAPSQLSVVA